MNTPYEQLGDEGVRALVDRFYEVMGTRPDAAVIRAMHEDDLAVMSDKLATFLIGWMGGPQRYNERFGRVVIPAAHQRFDIGPAERDAWLACMQDAVDESALSPDMRARVMDSFGKMAEMCRTRD
ncbi:MAG: group II truncated hemoglobin [Myxococcales bacterium]|nr:group II truncated hemoglobin [Myxococcales bacterium]MCB9627723.1 group II truncated hemoglobin [Sandaracinaceae bacterium]